MNLMNSSRRTYGRQDPEAVSQQPSQSESQRNSELKQLLGELYTDLEYLQQFAADSGSCSNNNNN